MVLASKDRYTSDLVNIVDEYHEISLDSSGVNPIKDLKLVFEIYNILKIVKPIAILNFTVKPVIYGTLAGRLCRNIPVINTITGLGTAFITKSFTTVVVRLMYRFTFRFSHLVCFQNPDDQRYFEKLKIITKNKTKVLGGSGVDLSRFYPCQNRERENTRVLFVGRIIADKGIYELIEAAKIVKKEYPKTIFTLMGMIGVDNRTSISEIELDKWVSNGIIEYIPFRDDIRPVLSDSDLVVLPSYREGTPKTLIEAASMSKPLIATDVPGCREVVLDGVNGFLCEVKNSLSLANKIIKFIKLDYNIKIKMGLKSRNIAEKKFDIIKVNQSYIKDLQHIRNKNEHE